VTHEINHPGVIVFPPHQLLETETIRNTITYTLGYGIQIMEIGTNTDTSYQVPFEVILNETIFVDWSLWKYPLGHRIDRIKEFIFPVDILCSIGFVIDPEPLDLQREDSVLRGQMYHLGNIVTNTRDMGLPLCLICLTQNKIPRNQNILVKETLQMPHVQIRVYHLSETDAIQQGIANFLNMLDKSRK